MAAIASQLICAALLAVGESRPHAGSGQTLPRSGAVSSGLITSTNKITVLTAKAGEPAIVTLDYGRAIEGIPTFEVVSIEGDTSVFEITYAESPAALSIYMVRLAKYNSYYQRLTEIVCSRVMGLCHLQPGWTHIESTATTSQDQGPSPTVSFKAPSVIRNSTFLQQEVLPSEISVPLQQSTQRL